MKNFLKDLSLQEKKIFRKINTPSKIQDFLDNLPINFEEGGDTIFSPRTVLERNKAHCLEGALFACAVLSFHGYQNFLLDLQPGPKDDGHAVALFKVNDRWGAISKTNHAVLRFRDPVYLSPRELAMSYFHEYFLDNGKKTLRTYTVFKLNKIKKNWITDGEDLWYIDHALNETKYTTLIQPEEARKLRKASLLERKVGKVIEWKRKKV